VLGDISRAIEKFNDPTQPKDILDGILRIFSGKDAVDFFARDPVISYNIDDNSVVVIYTNSKASGQPITAFYDNPSLLPIYGKTSSTTTLPVLHSIGPVTFAVDASGDTYGAFTDANGLKFGEQMTGRPELGPQFDLYFDKAGQPQTQLVTDSSNLSGAKG
jgi:hypothetical protein